MHSIWPYSFRIADDICNHESLQQIHVSKATFDELQGRWEQR